MDHTQGLEPCIAVAEGPEAFGRLDLDLAMGPDDNEEHWRGIGGASVSLSRDDANGLLEGFIADVEGFCQPLTQRTISIS